MKKKGLTLVELLIVIGVIAVLAGLLFPVFTSVRERAYITYCVNNLKQVGSALHLYAQDYDGFVPPYTNFVMDVVSERVFYFPNSNDPSLFQAAYEPYTRDRSIWYCPLDPFAGMDTPRPPGRGTWAGFMWGAINHKATSYDINQACSLRTIAPIHISSPPPKKVTVTIDGKSKEFILGQSYALDFTNTPYPKYYIGINLFFDGSVKVTRQEW